MKRHAGVLVALVAVVALGGCSRTIFEELPTASDGAENGLPGPAPQPVVVQPVPIPSPNNGPAPNPAPTSTPAPNNPGPTPRPTSTPPPPSGGSGNVAQVTAGVHSYLRNGQLIPRSGTQFQVGDVLYLNCTPRNSEGQPVDHHGPLQGWYHQGTARYTITDTHTFNPDCHTQGKGYVDISCQVDGVRAPWKRLHID